MLNMRFTPDTSLGTPRVAFDPPYEILGRWFESDVQTSPFATRDYIRQFKAIVAGTDSAWVDEEGNAWRANVDREWAELTQVYESENKSVRVPTLFLIDALEKWLEFIIVDLKVVDDGG